MGINQGGCNRQFSLPVIRSSLLAKLESTLTPLPQSAKKSKVGPKRTDPESKRGKLIARVRGDKDLRNMRTCDIIQKYSRQLSHNQVISIVNGTTAGHIDPV
jgi:hypothetical protein